MRACIREEIKRDATGAPCSCGGYGDEMEEQPTEEEIKAFDCGCSFACCTSAFKCRVCGAEFIARRKAPDMG